MIRIPLFISIVLAGWLVGGPLGTQLPAQEPVAAGETTPAEDLQAMQGRWRVRSIYLPTFEGLEPFPNEVPFATQDAEIQISQNRVTMDGQLAATLANDLDMKPQAEQVGMTGYRLIMVTLPSGKGLLCSYRCFGQSLELTYTHRCSCHRGSGHILAFERVKSEPATDATAAVSDGASGK